MELKFADYTENWGATLSCPNCQSIYLHHERVEVFYRGKEDAVEGIHTTILDGKVTTNTSLQGNPSRRRDGLAIHFRCEDCKKKSKLTVAQHKGNTVVDIVYADIL